MNKAVLPILAALALSACATAPTVYQPAAGPKSVGFSELKIEAGRYRITFHGGAGGPAEQVSDYALLRAADLALADGYDWFRVTDRYMRQDSTGGSRLSVGVGGGDFGYRSGVASGWARASP